MIEAEHLIFCNLIQETPQGVNLLGVFDLIVAEQFPARHHPFLAQAWLRAKKTLYNQDIHLKLTVDFEDTELSNQEVTLERANALQGDSLRVNIDFSGIVFEKPGKYYFKLYAENKHLLTRVLRVRSTSELNER